ncbi:hypothetical protein IGI04_007609 [Brassica rapa subsp. trilocularis]|uniref:Uncharacterized protein n=1 Tax=Brassica rapa subsp. trilocularis TaxID=1813537 RepID=A0ABQ7NK64_BRACM|nr:hypothetical protein IGI04_007609 [Brassica rapa subsp. trilocularis]
MYALKVFFSDLKSGKCSSVVEARLLRSWEAKNVKRDGELMWVDMLLIDVNKDGSTAPIIETRMQEPTLFRVMAADSRSPRDGKHIEVLGYFNPLPGQDGGIHGVLCAAEFMEYKHYRGLGLDACIIYIDGAYDTFQFATLS